MFQKSFPLPRKRGLVIIGAGVTGLSVGYNLARRGFRDFVILDKSWVTSGSSGRNGGGIREQFNSPPTITLMRHSIDLFERLPIELGFNFYFRQDGYLFLAFSEQQMEYLATTVRMQNELGVKSRILTPAEIKHHHPNLAIQKIRGGAFNQRDGTAVPFAYCWGLLKKLMDWNIPILPHTPVTRILGDGNRVTGVATPAGEIESPMILNATNAWSRELTSPLGLDIPVSPERHQILATEPLKPFIHPMVVSLESGLYFSQTSRGEIVGGIGMTGEPREFNLDGSVNFLTRMATHLVALLPGLAHIPVMRHWAGVYGVTPDHNPIFDCGELVKGLFQAVGFSGHGFMMAPAVGEIMADLILGAKPTLDISSFAFKRFAAKTYRAESSILG